MAMPKGFKKENGYFTAKSVGGKGFREISEIMTRGGDKMNHSTARNIFVGGMIRIVQEVVETETCQVLTYDEAKKIAIDPRFQSAVAEIMQDKQ